MPYVVARWWYPSHRAEEVAKIFQKRLKDGPPEAFVAGIGEPAVGGAYRGSKGGMVGMSFTKVAPGDIAQAMVNAASITSLYNKVEGYEWNIEVWGDVYEQPPAE
ncbi:MAG: hypothetical protein ACXADU_14180 [Promethearchaeota archaeon]|jgi:hypothetical protein